MTRDSKFWVFLAMFQVLFGLAIFAATRAYYSPHPAEVPAAPQAATQSPLNLGPGGITELAQARLSHSSSSEPASASQDPAELSRQASQAFSNRQYDQALSLYQQLLTLNPDSVDLLNEIGLTLQYLGRSSEALQRLNEGVAKDPKHQRIRLTLGYVNLQLGNIKEARAALTAATQLGTDAGVRQSAQDMLKSLPQ